MKNILLFVTLLFFGKIISGQETIGLVSNNLNFEKSEGYTMFNPLSDDRVFLVNNCGEVINQWDFSGDQSVSSYLLENGNLLQSNRDRADIRDWNNNVIWSIVYDDLGFTIHHDIEPMPNGNFLVMVRDRYTREEMIALGKDPSFDGSVIALDKIVEIEPIGSDSANIVWEWKFVDHLVQDIDSSKPNFGVVANFPELLDINYDDGNDVDFIHLNGIDYNEELDQIIISARHLHEILIIDHSTTTAEAATHSGGNSGKGGDFLWRWGNPEVYKKGTTADRQLGRQHDSKWVEDGEFKNKISVFSNDAYGTDTSASSVHIIEPEYIDGNYEMSSGKFLPNDYLWSWDGTILDETMHGTSRCGVQIMANGSALINETGKGRLSEVNQAGNVVWVYEIPVGNGVVFDQFTEASSNGTFKANRYHESYSGFNGIELNNEGIIEDVNSISENCSSTLSSDNPVASTISIYPNPVVSNLNIKSNLQIEKIRIYDLTGKLLLTTLNESSVSLENFTQGIYLLQVSAGSRTQSFRIVKR